MKILQEAPGHPTIIELEANESAVIFHEDGCHTTLMTIPDEDEHEDEDAKPSAIELTIAMIALLDPRIRSLIEETIEDA